ncbi:MAG: DUF3570 domain-containing protein [Burkholderiaceae bacterium]
MRRRPRGLDAARGGRVSAIEPVLSARRTDANERTLSVSFNLDAVTGASPNGAVPQPTPQTFTSPSRGDTPRAYGVKGMPTSVLIGADGVVLQQHAGFRDDDKAALEAAIVAALARAGR